MHWYTFSLDDPHILKNAETVDQISFLQIVYFLKGSVIGWWFYGFLLVSLQLFDNGGVAVELDVYVAKVEVLMWRLFDNAASESVEMPLLEKLRVLGSVCEDGVYEVLMVLVANYAGSIRIVMD